MEEKKLEAVMLDRIVQLVDRGKRKPEKHNWLVTACIWVVVGVGSFFVSGRFGGSAGGRTLVVVGAFIAGVLVTYAVLTAWHSSLWSHASRYLDIEAIRRRTEELK